MLDRLALQATKGAIALKNYNSKILQYTECKNCMTSMFCTDSKSFDMASSSVDTILWKQLLQ